MAGVSKKRTSAKQETKAAEPDSRPPSSGKPLVWATSRGGLCEAVPYFKSFKSSLYTNKGVAYGFLIDHETDGGDAFDAQVIITTVGGGRVRDSETGAMVRVNDASDTTPGIKSLMNSHHSKTLMAVIAGEGNPLYQCRPPYPYAVLGWFHITDLWKERQMPKGGSKAVTIWRIRFEKADLSEPSWWFPEGECTTVPSIPINKEFKAPVVTCAKCSKPSKEIFATGWFCLNHECEHYWVFPTGAAVDTKGLAYSEAFLNERTPLLGEIPPIRPPIPDTAGLHGTELALRRGFVCPDCGCCNRRVYWNRWVCDNKECQYTRDAPMLPYPADLLEQENAKFDNHMGRRRATYGVNENTLDEDSYIFDPFATIYQRGYLQFSLTLKIGGFEVRQYFLPDSQGRVLGSFSIFSASKGVNSKPNGPDDLFRTLELTDIGLRRNPAAQFGHKLEGYTRHFQQNFGARYKFGVSVQSKGFNEAPDVILRALHRLIWAKKVAVENSNAFIGTLDPKFVRSNALVPNSGDFNELLALGYMEDDKINYHDDGESELGPVVAALSLGSPSTMRFRPKRKTQFFLPTQQDRGKACYKEVLEVPMKHGDMMVMVGTEIQKVYEHTVDPYGMRRFSLTARYIDPERMTLQADRDDAAVKGAIPKHAEAFVYDGY
ncbi:hypothetical protein N657DRAFT_615930 [Parathielavia appendiculata]|uniref:Alpha-ketoglutarate-dependent dioxygenase AlkB-like domain-containing protein n=1 Tax=Parathielavia appendiculata TaxID=2587402 RepID=A0AAN6U4C8_9PEZI|nr:hypothetical protein N657DRAFT_615930 [Parathielavia appendiculata]